jgi:predicted dehydrogenase
MTTHSLSRRQFVRVAGAAAAAPLILSSRSWAQAPANSRINLGFIGMGKMNRGHLGHFLGRQETQVVAVCDVDTNRREHAKQQVEQHYANKTGASYKGCEAYNDFRELLAREDIDAVVIATPDHWHALNAIAAVKAGKDVYCEKPLTHNVHEAVTLTKAVRDNGRIFQTGSQQRSSREFRVACELVRNGRVGNLHTVKVGLPGDPAGGDPTPMPVPEGLDYDAWLGTTPYVPYTEDREHTAAGIEGRPGWLRCEQFSAGMITGWGAHHIDTAQWGMGTELTGPVEIRNAKGVFPPDELWDTATDPSASVSSSWKLLFCSASRGTSSTSSTRSATT